MSFNNYLESWEDTLPIISGHRYVNFVFIILLKAGSVVSLLSIHFSHQSLSCQPEEKKSLIKNNYPFPTYTPSENNTEKKTFTSILYMLNVFHSKYDEWLILKIYRHVNLNSEYLQCLEINSVLFPFLGLMKTNFTAFISVSSYIWLDAGRFSNKFLGSVKGYSTVFISWVILGKWESVGRSVPLHDEKCLSETRGDRLAHCKLLRRLVICQTTSCKTRKSNRISQSGIFKSVPKCCFFPYHFFLFYF